MKTPSLEADHGPHESKLIQICASQNDLFALDGDGVVYQYQFTARMWKRLGERRAFSAVAHEERA